MTLTETAATASQSRFPAAGLPGNGWTAAAVSACTLRCGAAQAWELVTAYPTPTEAFEAMQTAGDTSLAAACRDAATAPTPVDHTFTIMRPAADAAPGTYPPGLVTSGPHLLFGLGNASLLRLPPVAVIGPDDAPALEEWSTMAATAATTGASAAGVPVAFLGAGGADSVAARTAVQLGCPIVLVTDTDPAAHPASDWVVANNGAVISTRPFDGSLPSRSGGGPDAARLLAALASVVVCAGGQFGTVTAARTFVAALRTPILVTAPPNDAGPDAALSRALAHPRRPDAATLKRAGADPVTAAAIAAGTGSIAAGTAEHDEGMVTLTDVAVRMSPLYTPQR